jgi:teichuronic acid biosynthesis glycosyltransferase TuaC
MRILTFTKLYPWHGIFVARRVAALARACGHEVEVVAPVPYFPKFLPARGEWKKLQLVPNQEERDGLKIYHPRYFNPPKVGMARYGRWMARGSAATVAGQLRNGFPFDVIDAHFVYPDGYAALQIGRQLKRPVVVTARGSDVARNKHFPHIRPLLREVMRGAAQLIAVSEELRNDSLELGASPEKIHVIPNGIDTNCFHPKPREVACHELGLQPEDRWLICVGRLDHNKGQWLILEALKKFGRDELRRRRIKLALIGAGEDREKLGAVVKTFGLTEVVRFTGQLPPEKIATWYSAATIKILASCREGSPNVVLEALACGAPVVATRAGRNTKVIQEGKHGLLFPAEDAVRLQAAILQALDQDWKREEIAHYGRQRSWATVAREVESVLQLAI